MTSTASDPWALLDIDKVLNTPSPCLLLDIDGVFNPHMGVNLPAQGFTPYSREWITWALNVGLHAPMIDDMEEHATVVWCSTWGEESNALADWLLMRELSYPHIPLDLAYNTDNPGVGITWKLPAVKAWVDENLTPQTVVVWVDDELEADAFEWAKARGSMLLVKTDPAVGLTAVQGEEIVNFLR